MAGFGDLENVTLLNNYGSLFGYPFVKLQLCKWFSISFPHLRGVTSAANSWAQSDTVTRLVEPWARFSCEILVMQKDSVQTISPT